MRLSIQIFLMIVSLWSAHLAGAMYIQAVGNRPLLKIAILRSGIAALSGALIFIV